MIPGEGSILRRIRNRGGGLYPFEVLLLILAMMSIAIRVMASLFAISNTINSITILSMITIDENYCCCIAVSINALSTMILLTITMAAIARFCSCYWCSYASSFSCAEFLYTSCSLSYDYYIFLLFIFIIIIVVFVVLHLSLFSCHHGSHHYKDL